MKVLGIVSWKTTDKLGNPIAGVVPLIDVSKDGWRPINAQDEFPKQGQIFWPLAKDASERSLVFVNAKDNPGQKDEFRVESTEPVTEIIDVRNWGTLAAIRTALIHGVRRTDLAGKSVFLWYEAKKLLGPVRLVTGPVGSVVLDSGPKDRIRTFGIAPDAVRTVNDGRVDRHVLGAELGVPSGFIDWDEDRVVLRRALATAVELAKERRSDPHLTKRLIEEAAEDVAAMSTGSEAALNQYRLQRAAALCADAVSVERLGADLCGLLLEHPSVKRVLDEQCKQRVDELGTSLRTEAEKAIATERTELRELESALERARAALKKSLSESRESEEALAALQANAIRSEEDVRRAFVARVEELMQEPGRLLAEVAVIKPFLQAPAETENRARTTRLPLGAAWPRSATQIEDRLALHRAMNIAFKAAGLAPTSAVRIHAALVAGLLPVVIGSASLAALVAYARVVCGGRHAMLHVSPAFSQPQDLLGFEDQCGGFSGLRGPGLVEAVTRADGIPSFSLFICEGINRAPTESYLLPFLQMQRAGIALPVSGADDGSSVSSPGGLRMAATAIAGSTCLPVAADLWAYAVAIEVEEASVVSASPGTTEVLLSSELATGGAVPRETIDELLEHVPAARGCLANLELFGASLSRFDNDAARVKRALIECILVPQIASMSTEERSGGIELLKRAVAGSDEIVAGLERLEQRLRSRLG